MWLPLSVGQVDALFPDLKQKVLDKRRRSRSKNKAHDEVEYEWGIHYCVAFGLPGFGRGRIGASLQQRWKYRVAAAWQTGIPGPNGTNDFNDCFTELSKLLEHYNLTAENTGDDLV